MELQRENIAFELRNSHVPMYILHDIYLEDGDLSAQIDYLVFTKKICFVIECKNLFGDIEINSRGNLFELQNLTAKRKGRYIFSYYTESATLRINEKIRVDNKEISLPSL